MKSFYANRAIDLSTEHKLLEETISFYTLYLFAENSWYYANFCHFVTMWNLMDKYDDLAIIRIVYFLDPEMDNPTREQSMFNYEGIRKLKALKHKDKRALQLINEFKSFIGTMKQIAICELEKIFKNAKLWEWISLFDNETATIFAFKFSDNFKDNEEDELIGYFHDAFCNSHDFLFLNFYVDQIFNAISIPAPNDVALKADTAAYYHIPLFSFPFHSDITKDNLKIIRAHMQEKMKNISLMTEAFKSEVNQMEFNSQLNEICCTFYQQISPEIKIMQQHIDNELYFQQVIKSHPAYLEITLNLGVAPVTTIIEYYVKAGTLKPYVADALKRQLSFKTDINKCDVFLYYSVDARKPFL